MQKQFIQRLFLILFASAELSYYLLIAQTGIIEHFNSNISQIILLPIGGILGSLLCFLLNFSNKSKIFFFLSLQVIISFFYPNFSYVLLLILGISIGALAPLLIKELKKLSFVELGIALAISYTLATLLFTYDVENRKELALFLSFIALFSSFNLPKKIIQQKNYNNHSLFIMSFWVFLDASLFETLSRHTLISIWRDGYTFEIVLFHLLGIAFALKYQFEKKKKEIFILSLFVLSYISYFLQESFILSIVYPFVISYYNITIIQDLLQKDLKTISLYMIFIGWLASGLGLGIAINQLLVF